MVETLSSKLSQEKQLTDDLKSKLNQLEREAQQFKTAKHDRKSIEVIEQKF